MGFFQHVLPCRLVDPGGFVCYNIGKGGIFLHKSIFDDDTFFDGYWKIRENENSYNALIEQPAMHRLLPDVRQKRVLDLGCGYGINCMELLKAGAASITGIDLSEKMLETAKQENAGEKISYLCMDMEKIDSLTEKFDFIYSSLAFHYVEQFEPFVKKLAAALNPGGILLFSQEHPIVTATVDGKGHWILDEEGRKHSYAFSDYGRSGRRVIHWMVDGVVKYHRTVGEIVTALCTNGFRIEVLDEPVPEDWAIQQCPSIACERLKPSFLIIRAVRL